MPKCVMLGAFLEERFDPEELLKAWGGWSRQSGAKLGYRSFASLLVFTHPFTKTCGCSLSDASSFTIFVLFNILFYLCFCYFVLLPIKQRCLL